MKEYVLDILAPLNERGADYGDMRVNLDRIARQWSVTLETDVTAAQVALCMVQLKAARLVQTPDHQDTIRDLIGYGLIYKELTDE